ncbi:TPA: hypothetical protein NPN63_005443 [Klebsiella pneumoniae]|nr:hypothetical protein [Klebsiella pneumoniae]
MKNKLITFEGLDFNEVEKRKGKYVSPTEFVKMIGEEGLDIGDDLFYFGEFVRHVTTEAYNRALVMNEKEMVAIYACYYLFCQKVDRECYRLMDEDGNENKSFADFIGFHPGRLFGKTVDAGNLDIFEFLYKHYYLEQKAFV